jgi:hypothetical protein
MVGTAVYLFGFSYATVRRLLALPNPLADGSEGPGGPVSPARAVTYPTTPKPATSEQDPVPCSRV